MKTSDLQELMFREEALVPELEPYVGKSSFGSIMIHHPLIIEMFFDPKRAALINARYVAIKAEVEKAFAAKDWSRYLAHHNRGYRFQALERAVEAGLTGPEYWELLGWVWTDSENIYQHFEEWEELWSRSDVDHSAMMDEEEVAKLDSLPDTVTVWRGTRYEDSIGGLSWTLDKDKAIWFARRFQKKGNEVYVVHGEVKKSDVKALFLGRGENEIVSPFVKVKKIEVLN